MKYNDDFIDRFLDKNNIKIKEKYEIKPIFFEDKIKLKVGKKNERFCYFIYEYDVYSKGYLECISSKKKIYLDEISDKSNEILKFLNKNFFLWNNRDNSMIINNEVLYDGFEIFKEYFKKVSLKLIVKNKVGEKYTEIFLNKKIIYYKAKYVRNNFVTKIVNYYIPENFYEYNSDEKIWEYMPLNNFEKNFIEELLLNNSKIVLKNELAYEIINLLKRDFENIKVEDMEFKIENKSNVKIYADLDINNDIILEIKYDKEESLTLKQVYSIFRAFNLELTLDKENKTCISNGKEKETFLKNIAPELSKILDFYISEDLKIGKKVFKFKPIIGVRVSEGLININFEDSDISKEEIIEILKTYRSKKKFYELKSGEKIEINTAEIEYINEFLEDIDIDNLSENQISVPLYRIYQFKNLENDYVKVEKNNEIDEIFEKKALPINPYYYDILKDYQKEGINWLLNLRLKKLSGILADDMGLGKTLQIIVYLESIKFNKPCLIITPASLLLNWENEFKKFDSSLEILLINGDSKNRKNNILNINKQVVLTTYDYLKIDKEMYKNIEFDTMILDEAQNIKNPITATSKSVKSIKADNKIALSGTPIENTLTEIWSIFDFLMPKYLFKYSKFKKRFEIPIVKEGKSSVKDKLNKMIKPFILRRLKKDVLKELPDKLDKDVYITMTPDEKKIYEVNAISISKKIKEIKEDLNIKDNIGVLALISKLRKLCIDQRLVFPEIKTPSSKIIACIKLIKLNVEENKKILIFSSFSTVLDLIIKELENEGIKYYKITGKTTKENRDKYVKKFEQDDTHVFLISLKAGGTGLNLTSASVVIHVDPWWNISAQNQATDRAYRMGQKNIVQVIKLITLETIEEKIRNIQINKKWLSDTFIENSDGGFINMDKNELIELFNIEESE